MYVELLKNTRNMEIEIHGFKFKHFSNTTKVLL